MEDDNLFLLDDMRQIKDSFNCVKTNNFRLHKSKAAMKGDTWAPLKPMQVTVPVNLSEETPRNGEQSLSPFSSGSTTDQVSSSDSSIEVTRDAEVDINIRQAVPFFHDVRFFSNFNSTLNDELHSAPIGKVGNPLVSPIEGYISDKQKRKCTDQNDNALSPNKKNLNNVNQRQPTPKHVSRMLSQLKYVKTKVSLPTPNESPVIEESTDDDWVKNKRWNMQKDPAWLTNDAGSKPLQCVSPRTYTPARKSNPQSLTVSQPLRKAVFRSSSPNVNPSLRPKAKKNLIENLDISSIAEDESLDSSVELMPRDRTRGTINSQEIVPYSLDSSPSLSFIATEPAMDDTPTEHSKLLDPLEVPLDPIALLPSPVASPVARCKKKYRKLCCPRGGSAADDGLIRIHDIVLSVNQIDLTKISYREALKHLRDVPVDSKAVLVIQGPSGYCTRLQTTFAQGSKPSTVRVSEPTNGQLPGIPNNTGDKRTHQSPLDSGGEDADSPQQKHHQHHNRTQAGKKNATTESNGRQQQQQQQQQQQKQKAASDKGKTPYFETGKAADDKMPVEQKDAEIPNGPAVEKKQSLAMVKNWETDKVYRDTLHVTACPVNSCMPKRCHGSQMTPAGMSCDPMKPKRTNAEMKELSDSFIEQYYDSMKRRGSDDFNARLAEVRASIDKTGTYELTSNELIFGAKMAWRNAPRCVGRIQWNKLHVFDCRHIKTASEMFEAICTQIKFATNKGNIRSSVTFFPPRNDLSTEFRVWNNQLIRYAGYRQSDGSVIGDPVNVEFTQLCERLGWKGKGGRFDVLPLLLQANGEDPELFEMPDGLVMEVQLRHPRFDWFNELALKWYAVPAVSNILLDIGGIEFSAAPFNGWFMGTEIARDLCDVQRYNVLQSVATKMGLDTRKTSSLWKDTALLEMNVAVLHSYQSANVTIMDHHTATESFMKHFANEMRLRGGCPGDWVWLVPPISGSATPVFHQEIMNYMLNPACLYQPDPWRYYKFKNSERFQVKKKINFRELAKSVLLTSTMMTKALASRIKATILYGTETGKSYDYARTLQQIFNHAFDAKVYSMDEFELYKLEYETLVIVVTSTFGNGDPPGNAEVFAENLHKMERMHKKDNNVIKSISKAKRFQSVATTTPTNRRASARRATLASRDSFNTEVGGPLANIKFAVFGLGSRAYPHFCAFAHAIDSLLGEMEGERVLEIGEGDELCGQEESFNNWAREVYKASCETFCLSEEGNANFTSSSLTVPSYEKDNFRVTVQPPDTEEPSILSSLEKLHRKKVSSSRLKARVNLQSEKSSRSTIKVELSTEEDSRYLQFKPGDHLGIYPSNDPALVKELLLKLRDAPEEFTTLKLEFLSRVENKSGGHTETWNDDLRLPACTLWTAFSRFLDITTPPTPKLLRYFGDCAVNPKEKERLEMLSEGKKEYEDWKFYNVPNLVEVLEEFPSILLMPSLLLSQLPLLQCRYYSISSSPDVHPNEIHCTVSVVKYQAQGGQGPLHHGVCSTYLDNLTSDEDIPCFVRPAPAFHLPEDPSLPCLLVGPGTGIAPFRSFWQQRLHETNASNANKRTLALLFGCRHPEQDHLYKEEVVEAKKKGAITHNYTAFSRIPNTPKKYVQDVIKNEIADFVYDSIVTKSGHFFVCGDVTMSADVNKALKIAIAQSGKMTAEEAEAYVVKMKEEERYHEDIFGITLRTYEVSNEIRTRVRLNSAVSSG